MSDWKAKLQGLLRAYGPVAAGVWFVLFGLTWAGFAMAIGAGFEVDGAASTAGTLGAAYVATQLAKPLRIAGTLALTPVVGRLLGRRALPETDEPPAEGGAESGRSP